MDELNDKEPEEEGKREEGTKEGRERNKSRGVYKRQTGTVEEGFKRAEKPRQRKVKRIQQSYRY